MSSAKPKQRWHLFPAEEPPLDVPVFVEEENGRQLMAERTVEGDDNGYLVWALCYGPPWRGDGAWKSDGAECDDIAVVAWHPLPERRRATT